MSMLRTVIVVTMTFLAAVNQASAWCFGPKGCETDDSVCDLGRDSAARIGRLKFVPANAPNEREIYSRQGKAVILSHCVDGQLLLLNSEDDDMGFNRQVLPEIAKAFCRVASIEKTDNHQAKGSSEAPRMATGFDLKCRISKMREAKDAYEAQEKDKSTDAMIAEANAPTPAGNGEAKSMSAAPSTTKPECQKMGFSTYIGLTGACSGSR
jgi:hypothetical protein